MSHFEIANQVDPEYSNVEFHEYNFPWFLWRTIFQVSADISVTSEAVLRGPVQNKAVYKSGLPNWKPRFVRLVVPFTLYVALTRYHNIYIREIIKPEILLANSVVKTFPAIIIYINSVINYSFYLNGAQHVTEYISAVFWKMCLKKLWIILSNFLFRRKNYPWKPLKPIAGHRNLFLGPPKMAKLVKMWQKFLKTLDFWMAAQKTAD